MQQILTKPKISVIRPLSSLDAITAMEFLQELTTVILQDSCSILLVNLEQVNFLDSIGLMALLSGLKLAKKLGRRLSLCSVSPQVKIIFELTQLDKVFEIFESQSTYTNQYEVHNDNL